MGAWLSLLLLIGSGTLLIGRPDISAYTLYDPADAGVMMAASALVIFVITRILGDTSGIFRVIRFVITWSAVGFLLVAGYTYRDEILTLGHQVVGDMLPPNSIAKPEFQTEGERSVRIRRRGDGHFVANTQINGVGLPMLIDTGASTVVLKPADAQRLGVDVDKLRYTVPVQTANGTTYAAHVRLRTIKVGPIEVGGVEALVAKPGALKDSLLGMTFLNRLRSYEFSGEFLTLRS
jgi:aspartyl protease family protein